VRINALTSPTNNLLKKIRSLHERNARHKAGLFLIEGEKIFLEAVARGIDIEAVVLETEYFQKGISQVLEDVLADPDFLPEGISLAPPNLFRDLITTTTSCGLVAVARQRVSSLDIVLGIATDIGSKIPTDIGSDARTDIGSPPFPTATLLILEGVQDPGNLGSIMRSALAFSVSGLILSRGTVDPFNPKVVRSAMGALFDLPIVLGQDLQETLPLLKKAGFALCSLNPEASQSLTEAKLPAKLALILGNEGGGLSPEATAAADFDLRIDMSDRIESLNVSIASAIVLFHLANVAKGK